MTGRRNIIIAINAIVVFAAIVGFFITLDVSPQIAYARLFIDAGLVIGLIAVIMAFYRERPIPTENVVNALRNLKSGKYSTRLNLDDVGPLTDIATSINELAITLEAHHARQEEIKRNLREELLPGIKAREIPNTEHSYHPELGPVNAIAHDVLAKIKPQYGPREMIPEPIPTNKNITIFDQRLSNTLIESNPPKEEPKLPEFKLEIERQVQDLGDLYQRFIDAQRAYNLDQIEYPIFLKTIEKTKQDLMSTHQCQGVMFDIVKESDQVALQPRILR